MQNDCRREAIAYGILEDRRREAENRRLVAEAGRAMETDTWGPLRRQVERVRRLLHASLARRALGGLIVASVVGCSSPVTSGPLAPAPITASQPANSAAVNQIAPRPANASLKITLPTEGSMFSAGSIKVTLAYSGPTLVPGAQSTKLDDYHLHYFLDEDAAPFISGGMPIPVGNPRIMHSAATEVSFDNVAAGAHTITVVMTGNNHVPSTASVVDRVTFSVK